MYLAAKNLNSGSDNIAIGEQALIGVNAAADKNVAIGRESNKIVTTGASNITIGYQSGDNITSGDGNVIIGSINADSATADKQLIIADGTDGSVAWLKGDSSGNVSVPANLNLSGSNKELRFYEGANYVGFEAPALSADKIWVLPAADGSADQVLKTDGSGNLGWTAAGGGGAIRRSFRYAKLEGTDFTGSMIIGHRTTGTLRCCGKKSEIYLLLSTSMLINANDGAVTLYRDSTNLGHSDYGFYYCHVQAYPLPKYFLNSPNSTSVSPTLV